MRFLRLLKTAFTLLWGFSSCSASTGYLGSDRPDPGHIICIFSAGTESLPTGVWVALYFDYPVTISHSANLNTGSNEDGFVIHEPKRKLLKIEKNEKNEEKFAVFIAFSKQPVPVCVAINISNEPFDLDSIIPGESGLNLRHSSIIAAGKRTNFTENTRRQTSNKTQDTVRTPGLSILSVRNCAGATEAITLNFLLSSTENRLLLNSTERASALPPPLFDNLTVLQQMLFAALNARFNTERYVQGVNHQLFRFLYLENGIAENVMHAVINLAEQNETFREIALNEHFVSDDQNVQAFLTDWYQAQKTFIEIRRQKGDTPGNTQFESIYNLQDLVHHSPDYIIEHLEEISAKMILAVASEHSQECVYGNIHPGNFRIQEYKKITVTLDFRCHTMDFSPFDNPNHNSRTIENSDLHQPPISERTLYDRQVLDFKMLAIALLYVATGMLIGQNSDDQNRKRFFSREETDNALAILFSLTSGSHASQQTNIKRNLNSLSKQACGKKITDCMPSYLLCFISHLLEVSFLTGTNTFIPDRLSMLLQEYSALHPFIGLKAPLKSYDQELSALNESFGGTMTVQPVTPDGNCLPTAVAEALNTENIRPGQYTQEDIRVLLVRRFRTIIALIDATPNIRSFFNLPDAPELVRSRQWDLRLQLANLMSMDAGTLDNIRIDGSNRAETFGPTWLEPGLLAFLPFEGVTVNIYSPRTIGAPLDLSSVYNREAWANLAPDLIEYLEQNNQILPEPQSFIHLIHNGGANGREHYYFATPNIPEMDMSTEEMSDLPPSPETEKPGSGPGYF